LWLITANSTCLGYYWPWCLLVEEHSYEKQQHEGTTVVQCTPTWLLICVRLWAIVNSYIWSFKSNKINIYTYSKLPVLKCSNVGPSPSQFLIFGLFLQPPLKIKYSKLILVWLTLVHHHTELVQSGLVTAKFEALQFQYQSCRTRVCRTRVNGYPPGLASRVVNLVTNLVADMVKSSEPSETPCQPHLAPATMSATMSDHVSHQNSHMGQKMHNRMCWMHIHSAQPTQGCVLSVWVSPWAEPMPTLISS
jgi:hypothetical protein